MARGKLKARLLLGGLALLVLAIAGLVASLFSSRRVMYSLSVEQALGNFARFEGKPVRVRGLVVPGSLKRWSRECGADFLLEQTVEMTSGRYMLGVRYDGCVFPDVLCDLSGEAPGVTTSPEELSLEGQLVRRPDGHVEMEAKELLIMCPGKYESAASAPLCARYRPGDYCPVCEHVLKSRRGPL